MAFAHDVLPMLSGVLFDTVDTEDPPQELVQYLDTTLASDTETGHQYSMDDSMARFLVESARMPCGARPVDQMVQVYDGRMRIMPSSTCVGQLATCNQSRMLEINCFKKIV